MTATALRSQGTAVPARRNPLSMVKSIFFPVSPTYLLMVIPAIILFTFFIMYPAVQGAFWSFTNYVGYGSLQIHRSRQFQGGVRRPDHPGLLRVHAALRGRGVHRH